jgi:D-glycero-D-manno-heptose 1,7-bisphosphate phosphatase
VSGRRAVFLDRDGTIIEDGGFVRDPERVRLLPGAGDAIGRCARGALAIVVTNQSGLARAFSEPEYRAAADRMERCSLRRAPHRRHFHGPTIRRDRPCQCRKPGSLHYRQAAERFGLTWLNAGGWGTGRPTSNPRRFWAVGGFCWGR